MIAYTSAREPCDNCDGRGFNIYCYHPAALVPGLPAYPARYIGVQCMKCLGVDWHPWREFTREQALSLLRRPSQAQAQGEAG